MSSDARSPGRPTVAQAGVEPEPVAAMEATRAAIVKRSRKPKQ